MTTTMPAAPVSDRRLDRWAATIRPFLSLMEGPIMPLLTDPNMANFAVGNPQEMPMPGYVDALRRHVEPQDKDWFAYKMSEPASQATVARSLTTRTGWPGIPPTSR